MYTKKQMESAYIQGYRKRVVSLGQRYGGKKAGQVVKYIKEAIRLAELTKLDNNYTNDRMDAIICVCKMANKKLDAISTLNNEIIKSE